MKKRSMLAIASLATGFVVAAITPSHGGDHQTLGDHQSLGDLSVEDTVGTVADTVGDGSLSDTGKVLGQND
ncbi:hypothetical protein [Streptomyces cylindrosporus]|uniref:Secreted protein n=1 Tax=Streptomyces cylindrosporus TaxID=2927583 RepID=A0ABS9YE57_9ACTN|nr:hypothetical protein [Streptomyces cylindrosporus]MCI3275249.1 hypothetical protein [Streptomyces cylindrosporus]